MEENSTSHVLDYKKVQFIERQSGCENKKRSISGFFSVFKHNYYQVFLKDGPTIEELYKRGMNLAEHNLSPFSAVCPYTYTGRSF